MPELTSLGAVIKATYESEPDTNAFTDAEKSKLAAIDPENIGAVYDSVAAVEELNIPSGITTIRTNGYYAPGDGGGALYVRGNEAPGAIQSGDGAWWELAETVPNFRQFGVSESGTPSTNRERLQAGLDWAAAKASSTGAAAEITLPAGRYEWGDGTLDDETNWRHIAYVYDNTVVSGAGTLVSETSFSTRTVGFVVRGDNVRIKGISFDDTYSEGSPYIIPVGAGTAYDSGLESGRVYKNLTVDACIFRNAWLSASVQFVSGDDGTISWDGVVFKDCTSIGKPGVSSGGNFNARSTPPGKVKNVRMIGNSAEDGKTASSYNFVGVYGGCAVNNESRRNLYAACEIENGSQDIVVSDLRSFDEMRGLWIDDSRRIVWRNVSMLNETTSLDNPLGGGADLNRDAVFITRQGFAGEPDYRTTDIVGGGVVGKNIRIRSSTFGENPGGSFGVIIVDGFTILCDGVERDSGNVIINMAEGVEDLTLANGRVTGAPTTAIRVARGAGRSIRLQNLTTRAIDDEPSVGLEVTGSGGVLQASNCDFHALGDVSFSDATGLRINGVRQPDIHSQTHLFYSIIEDPENKYEAPPGSIAFRTNGSIYRKASGNGNTGWVALEWSLD